jgi:hypothetical protein
MYPAGHQTHAANLVGGLEQSSCQPSLLPARAAGEVSRTGVAAGVGAYDRACAEVAAGRGPRTMIAMDDLETLRARIADSGILASAIRIGLVAVPAWEVVDVVIQDEFTHDVVMTAPGVDAALVLDCT